VLEEPVPAMCRKKQEESLEPEVLEVCPSCPLAPRACPLREVNPVPLDELPVHITGVLPGGDAARDVKGVAVSEGGDCKPLHKPRDRSWLAVVADLLGWKEQVLDAFEGGCFAAQPPKAVSVSPWQEHGGREFMEESAALLHEHSPSRNGCRTAFFR